MAQASNPLDALQAMHETLKNMQNTLDAQANLEKKKAEYFFYHWQANEIAYAEGQYSEFVTNSIHVAPYTFFYAVCPFENISSEPHCLALYAEARCHGNRFAPIAGIDVDNENLTGTPVIFPKAHSINGGVHHGDLGVTGTSNSCRGAGICFRAPVVELRLRCRFVLAEALPGEINFMIWGKIE